MKRFLLSISICLAGFQAGATIHTVVTHGLQFVPDQVVARVGDTIEFDLSPGFTATEVSLTTWTANGHSPLVAQGAFDLESPNMVVMVQEGNRYYVCKWHHTTGMKGKIQVLGPTGVPAHEPDPLLSLYPNPTQNNLYLNIGGTEPVTVVMDIFDVNGQKAMDLGGRQVLNYGVKHIDVAMLPAGIYYLSVTSGNKTRTLRFLKQ